METTVQKTEATPLPVVYPLSTIYFYLTDGCNLRCRHCWIQPDFSPTGQSCNFIPLETFKSVVAQAKPLGLTTVKLTGGEPLLHPQIHEILDHIIAEGLALNMETNGVLCTPELAKKIAACKTPFVSVSFDGADAETHEWMRGVDGCFEDALRGFKNLVDAGLKPQVIMTITRRNFPQAETIVRMAEKIGAGSVKYNILQPTARGQQMHQAGEALTMEELLTLGERVEKEYTKRAKIPLFYSHPLAFSPLSRMYGGRGMSCGRCGVLGILGVLGDGSYAMCGIGETIPEFIFGNASKDRLEEIWTRTPILNDLRKGLPKQLEGICSDCIMKNTCQGNCIAQNYYRTKNLWAPFWYCEEARKLGKFPESRVLQRKPVQATIAVQQ